MREHGATWKAWLAGAVAIAAAACAGAPGGEPEVGVAEAALSEDELWILMIEAGRYGVIIDRATEGAIEGQPATILRDPTELESATRSLHHAAHDLYRLRAITCANGLVGPEDCGPLPPPDWLGEPAGTVADAAEIRRRIDWLTEAMAPFVAAGCDAGQSRRRDGEELPHYCSVE